MDTMCWTAEEGQKKRPAVQAHCNLHRQDDGLEQAEGRKDMIGGRKAL